jgi:two-component system, OmpR family, response regulator RegX3
MARILVVEDDTGQLEIRRQILEHAGHVVVTAQDAAQALDRLAGCELVVMDLRLPQPQDGLRLIEAASGLARIIVLSGGQPDASLKVNEFLTKPCSSKKLLETIAKWTSASK